MEDLESIEKEEDQVEFGQELGEQSQRNTQEKYADVSVEEEEESQHHRHPNQGRIKD